jgi:hypothetical protein
MQKKLWLLALAMVGAVLLSGTAAWADGEFYVIGGGGPPVGTKITSLPADGFTITKPGFYFLGGDLTYTGTSYAITISTDNVTIDLMGCNLTGPGKSSGASAISTNNNNVEIRNGTISNFQTGIFAHGVNNRASRIRVLNNGSIGIWLGSNGLVEGCNSSSNYQGIEVQSGTISGCIACNNTKIGIQLVDTGVVIGNVANGNGSDGFWLSVVYNHIIMVDRNSASGNVTPYNFGTNPNIVWGVNGGY